MTVKSQDDLGKQGRDSEVLLEAISKLETTTAELERTKKQLEIAVEALENYTQGGYNVAQRALLQIEELDK